MNNNLNSDACKKKAEEGTNCLIRQAFGDMGQKFKFGNGLDPPFANVDAANIYGKLQLSLLLLTHESWECKNRMAWQCLRARA